MPRAQVTAIPAPRSPLRSNEVHWALAPWLQSRLPAFAAAEPIPRVIEPLPRRVEVVEARLDEVAGTGGGASRRALAAQAEIHTSRWAGERSPGVTQRGQGGRGLRNPTSDPIQTRGYEPAVRVARPRRMVDCGAVRVDRSARLAAAAQRDRLTRQQMRRLDDPQLAQRDRPFVGYEGHDVPDAVTLDVDHGHD